MASGSSERRRFVGGNWKAAATTSVVDGQVKVLNEMGEIPDGVDVWLSPSAIHIDRVKSSVRKEVSVAAQNIHTEAGCGAFTGEITAEQVSDVGLEWVLIGHSERRTIFHETDEQLDAKVKAALSKGLKIVYCLGETLEEREAEKTSEVILAQIQVLANAAGGAWDKIVIAYEPIWAIGTGKTASPEQAQEAHATLRGWLRANVSEEVATSVRIIYGGSVKGANAESIISKYDIDGFLVGGASLKPEFADIIRAAK